jgi:hypothetical protein
MFDYLLGLVFILVRFVSLFPYLGIRGLYLYMYRGLVFSLLYQASIK